MEKIEATVSPQEMLCLEKTAGPAGFIVFGASGDLAHRKLFPSLYELYSRGLVSERFFVLGGGRTELTHDAFRDTVAASLRQFARIADGQKIADFIRCFYYVSGDYDQPALYEKISDTLMDLDEIHKLDGSHIFYLAVPPFLYETIIDRLGESRMMAPSRSGRTDTARLVIEKPFGRDLDTARDLDRRLHRFFGESQIYRIDHYLGKETVQNILMFRFANSIFEPVWNRNFIDRVEITIAETVGVEHRAGYYDKTGALRDMFQNHMLQMLALVAMEPPVSFAADSVRDEKVKLLRSIRPVTPEAVRSLFLRGRYAPGQVNGQTARGYRAEEGVAPDSTTETFVAGRLFIDNWRWKGVPFCLRTGKRLDQKLTEILITFRQVPHSMFDAVGLDEIPANTLRFQIQPNEGIFLGLQAKRPGSHVCMSTLDMAVDYQKVFGVEMPEAYQRLLLDAMLGDQTLFTRADSIETAWQLLMPILMTWQNSPDDLLEYPAGTAVADILKSAPQ